MPKLTKRTVDAIAASGREIVVWDSDLPGFGIRVKPNGTKSFLIQYRNKNGQSRRHTVGKYGILTPDAARQEGRRLLGNVALGRDPSEEKRRARGAMTVEALCQEYLERAEQKLILTRLGRPKSEATIATDRGRIDRHIIPLLGKRAVAEVSMQDVGAFVRAVTTGKTAMNEPSGKPRGRAVVTGGSGTATRTTGLLGAIFTYAVREDYRADNPVRGVPLPAYNKREERLSEKQFALLGSALRQAEEAGEPWQAILAIKLLALTGARRGEVVNLLRADADLVGHALRLSTSKTGRSVRPLSDAAVTVIKDAISRVKGSVYVFSASRGADVDALYGGLPNAWNRIVTPSLPGITAHTLRHTFASVASDLEYAEATIAALLGHASGSVTSGYIHRVDKTLIAAANHIAGEIARLMDGKRA